MENQEQSEKSLQQEKVLLKEAAQRNPPRMRSKYLNQRTGNGFMAVVGRADTPHGSTEVKG